VRVCGFQQFRRRASVLRIYADADADAQCWSLSPVAQCPLHALRNPVCHSWIGVDQNHGELVTAVSRR
jgi:hypothetical protein